MGWLGEAFITFVITWVWVSAALPAASIGVGGQGLDNVARATGQCRPWLHRPDPNAPGRHMPGLVD